MSTSPYTLRYLDGSPVDQAYATAIGKAVGSAAAAYEHFNEDELEEFARNSSAVHSAESPAAS